MDLEHAMNILIGKERMKDSKLLALILTVSLPTAHCLVLLFNVCHTFPLITYYFREFGLGSTNNPMTDIFFLFPSHICLILY